MVLIATGVLISDDIRSRFHNVKTHSELIVNNPPMAQIKSFFDIRSYTKLVSTKAVNIPAGKVRDLADVFRPLADAGRLRGFEALERFYEIGSPEGLADLEELLAAP